MKLSTTIETVNNFLPSVLHFRQNLTIFCSSTKFEIIIKQHFKSVARILLHYPGAYLWSRFENRLSFINGSDVVTSGYLCFVLWRVFEYGPGFEPFVRELSFLFQNRLEWLLLGVGRHREELVDISWCFKCFLGVAIAVLMACSDIALRQK